jgi:uncharacterized protein (UPF0264 family)
MELLVSVATAPEAAAALAGGAHIIDAKDPSRGALGAVSARVLRDICARIDGARPVSAALGDAADEVRLRRDAHAAGSAGVAFVKVGFAGVCDRRRAAALLSAAVSGAACEVVAVAYADAAAAGAVAPDAVVDIASAAGASGVLLDTADKSGPGLRELLAAAAIAAWVAQAHRQGLRVALAGQLGAADLAFARDAGADIVGVRGAVCRRGRLGPVDSAKVRVLADLIGGNRHDLDPVRERPLEIGIDEIAG